MTDENLIDYDTLTGMDLTIEKDASVPQILIYHTHSQEAFADSVEGDVDTTVVGVGSRLAEILEENYGYNVIHHTAVYDMVDGEAGLTEPGLRPGRSRYFQASGNLSPDSGGD